MLEGRRSWALCCAATLVPLTAMLHHALFYRPRCMLKVFGPDYDLETVVKWLSRDPSLPWAIVIGGLLYLSGIGAHWYARLVRMALAPFAVSFIPLSIWIWDIPFSGRWICRTFHDERLTVAFIGVVHTRHFYVLGLSVYSVLLAWSLFSGRRPSSGRPSMDEVSGFGAPADRRTTRCP